MERVGFGLFFFTDLVDFFRMMIQRKSDSHSQVIHRKFPIHFFSGILLQQSEKGALS